MELVLLKRKQVKSVRNARGIKVKHCCASCTHRSYDDDGCRHCLLFEVRVKQKDACKYWQMSEAHQLAGRRQGQVKRKDYLKFALQVRLDERHAIEQGLMTDKQRQTEKELRAAFEKENGSIYVF